MAIPKLALALGGGTLLLLLLAGTSKASSSTGPTPPNPLPPTPPTPPRPNPFPPGSALAVVSVPTGEAGINTRTAPNPNAPLIGQNDAFNGTTVAVLQTGIKEDGAPAGSMIEWWKIITPGGGTGFARAIGPMGEANLRSTGSVPLPRGAPTPIMSGMSVGYRPYRGGGWAPHQYRFRGRNFMRG